MQIIIKLQIYFGILKINCWNKDITGIILLVEIFKMLSLSDSEEIMAVLIVVIMIIHVCFKEYQINYLRRKEKLASKKEGRKKLKHIDYLDAKLV